MLLRTSNKKDNPIKGCLVTLLALVGFILVCFLFCTLMFQINKVSGGSTELLNLIFA